MNYPALGTRVMIVRGASTPSTGVPGDEVVGKVGTVVPLPPAWDATQRYALLPVRVLLDEPVNYSDAAMHEAGVNEDDMVDYGYRLFFYPEADQMLVLQEPGEWGSSSENVVTREGGPAVILDNEVPQGVFYIMLDAIGRPVLYLNPIDADQVL